MSRSTQVLGIGNAIVDVLAPVDKKFLENIGAPPGSMTLINQEQAHELYEQMGETTQMCGGSVANTIAGLANLGASTAFIGRLNDDPMGTIFVDDMKKLDVEVRLPPKTANSPTARCHALIEGDGQRTMQTYLGACTELSITDITNTTVGNPSIILLEGYIWDIPEGPAIAAKAIKIARNNNAAVALSLSDSLCVERHYDAWYAAIHEDIDIVFGNEDEVAALLKTTGHEATMEALSDFTNLFSITRSDMGSVTKLGNEIVFQEATQIEQIVDTTGAGDAYTAGFLFGWTSGKPLQECARIGNQCAASVIQQIGGRLEPEFVID
ncbi:MAG: adenosine kinase [Woeseia sp.]|nr:adenosine kinase [Woeseia sp.]|tara:strand:+ start:6719 stop:7690 length:972 start_codon:yes stop_codon:yes gene_type:complete